jgi:hypothetical protein
LMPTMSWKKHAKLHSLSELQTAGSPFGAALFLCLFFIGLFL